MTKVYLIGASGHAQVIIEMLEDKAQTEIGGLQDLNPNIKSILGYKVFNKLPEQFDRFKDFLIISIGDNATRKRIAESIECSYTNAIHDSANISKSIDIRKGVVIMAGVSINALTKIGNHTIINTNASIDHDCIIEDYVHVSPNVALAGNVQVGEGTHIGIGACVIQGIKIGKWCTIGAGAVIITDVPDGATVVGNPGRIIKIKDI